MKIREIMTTDPVTVTPGTAVDEVAQVLLDARINSIAVLDSDRHVLGMISTGDLTHRMADERFNDRESWWKESLYRTPLRRPAADQPDRIEGKTAAEVMTRRVISVTPNDDTSVAARMLLEHRIHTVPVTDGGQLVGTVSRFDLIRCLIRHPECCNPLRR